MATTKRRGTMRYESYGNVAYAPTHDGGAIAAPRRQTQEESIPLPRRRVQQHTETRALTRAHVQVRQGGVIAPFGILSFLVAGVFAFMLVMSMAQQTVLSAEVVALQSQYDKAEMTNSALSAQYEQVFDIASVEEAVAGAMVRPSSEQVVYIDLSQPDEVVLYSDEVRTQGVAGLLEGLEEIASELMAYFQ